MSGVHGHVLGPLVRRGVQAAQAHFSGPSPAIMEKLQHDANLYEDSDPSMEIRPQEMLPVMITAFLLVLLIASIRYTVGEVIASLAMIESPTTTAIIDDKPPAYADEPDAPLEKEPLMPAEAEADVEVLLIKNKPITAKITTTVGHLQRVGGFRARWRGLGWSFIYHGAHAMLFNFLLRVVPYWYYIGPIGSGLIYTFTSVALSRFHMLWTHSMIAASTNKRFWNRLVPRKQCKALLLPSLVFALAQQAVISLPLLVLLLIERDVDGPNEDFQTKCIIGAFRALIIGSSGLLVAFLLLLPATVTLTRIEAALLPEDEKTIVPFDRQALMGNVDLSVRGGCRALFLQAWRSFDGAARWRLIKLYLKMVLIQVTVVIVGFHLMVAEVYVIGGERLAIFIKSAAAQLQLAAIEARRHAN